MQVWVYVKPSAGQVVHRDQMLLAGYADLHRKAGDTEPCEDHCLGRWFADDGAELQVELDAALREMDKGMEAYFRVPPPRGQSVEVTPGSLQQAERH